MKDFLFISKLLPKLGEGAFFRTIFTYALKVLAVSIGIMSVVAWVGYWIIIFKLSVGGIIGGLIFQLIFVVAAYAVIHIIWIRADDIKEQEAGEFTIIPIISTMVRMFGEVAAAFLIIFGIGGGIFLIFAGWEAYQVFSVFLPVVSAGSAFLSGIMFTISFAIAGFLALIFHYLIAELIVILVDMARNIKAIRDNTEK